MSDLPEIALPPALKHLFERCANLCIPECCAIDAFSFDPLTIAFLLSTGRGSVDEGQVARLVGEIEGLEAVLPALVEHEHDFICSLELTNTNFTRSSLAALLEQIKRSVNCAHEVARYCHRLDRKHPPRVRSDDQAQQP